MAKATDLCDELREASLQSHAQCDLDVAPGMPRDASASIGVTDARPRHRPEADVSLLAVRP
jgi:hypothetical protein